VRVKTAHLMQQYALKPLALDSGQLSFKMSL